MLEELSQHLRDLTRLINVEYLCEVLLIYLVIYTFLRFMEGTRGEGILKGIALVIVTVPILINIIANRFGVFDRIEVILKFFGAAAIPALVIIVQPELRRALVRLGQTRFFGFIFKSEIEGIIDDIVKAAFRMAKAKVGALIAIEREVGLKSYIERGTPIDGLVSSQLLTTIFFPGSELHDGGVIIRNNRIAAAGCLFPLSENPSLPSFVGTRHRAGLGLSEETDAIAIIVSEESGIVSVAYTGKLERPLDRDQLRDILLKSFTQLEARAIERKRLEFEEPAPEAILPLAGEAGEAEKGGPENASRSREKAEV
jgi:diadenylate cyclase